jgi:hypothetical protein
MGILLDARTLTTCVAEAQSIRSNTGVKAVYLLFSAMFIGHESWHAAQDLTVKTKNSRLRDFHPASVYWVCS